MTWYNSHNFPVPSLAVLHDVKRHSVVSYQCSGGFLYEWEVLLQNGHQKATCAERRVQTFTVQYMTLGQEMNVCDLLKLMLSMHM